ncbi:hypothetical protein TNCV_4287731 [Trichonephila clavipes]|uniref:Uncharacterized protein n=1 Tax=Trichonephila clavipes TaxID=2585209 RepID=A0A8X6V7K9_TRICX|nr:hypothetical protein TNCV_4287731 [Trichonephila clavipes]
MPLSRMENTTFAMPSIIDSHDMGLRTVYSSDAQKKTPMVTIFVEFETLRVLLEITLTANNKTYPHLPIPSEQEHKLYFYWSARSWEGVSGGAPLLNKSANSKRSVSSLRTIPESKRSLRIATSIRAADLVQRTMCRVPHKKAHLRLSPRQPDEEKSKVGRQFYRHSMSYRCD